MLKEYSSHVTGHRHNSKAGGSARSSRLVDWVAAGREGGGYVYCTLFKVTILEQCQGFLQLKVETEIYLTPGRA